MRFLEHFEQKQPKKTTRQKRTNKSEIFPAIFPNEPFPFQPAPDGRLPVDTVDPGRLGLWTIPIEFDCKKSADSASS